MWHIEQKFIIGVTTVTQLIHHVEEKKPNASYTHTIIKDKKAIDATRIIVPKPTSKPLKSGRLSKIMAQLYLKGLQPLLQT